MAETLVSFTVDYKAVFGECLWLVNTAHLSFLCSRFCCDRTDVYISGSIPELGCWQVREAVRLDWVEEPSHWLVHVPLRCSTSKGPWFEYKYFVSSVEDVRKGIVHRWETLGPNRKAVVPKGDSPLVHVDYWGQTTVSSIMASPLIVSSPPDRPLPQHEYEMARNMAYELYYKRLKHLIAQSRA